MVERILGKAEVEGSIPSDSTIVIVPADHLLRSIDRFVDLSGIREHLRSFYRETGRPSIDPELMIRMLIVGHSLGIRSERRLCAEVHKLDRLRLRGPNGVKDEFHLAATAQNLRKMAKLIPMPAPAMAG